jgi:hypothetical protein
MPTKKEDSEGVRIARVRQYGKHVVWENELPWTSSIFINGWTNIIRNCYRGEKGTPTSI